MSALRFLFLTLLLAVDSVLSAEGQRIRAEAGQDSVTLPCGAGKETEIRAVEWSRPDLDPDYVLLFRDGQTDSEGQHPSFRNRVDLQDRQMKDGDASVILKNVKIEDTGTYECRVKTKSDSVPALLSSIHLVVSPPGTQEGGDKGRRGKEGGGKEGGGSLGLTVGLTVVSLLCVFGVAAWICYKKRACLQRNLEHHPVDQTEPKPV
ncbi:coxsackievirus and adenovirus receptor homolog isoform 2-T2 [Menidia menidia]